MKKILLFSLFILASLPLFSKEKSLKVIKTEWGFEISNIDEKGNRICKGNLFYSGNLNNVCVVFKPKNEVFCLEKFASKYIDYEFSSCEMLDDDYFIIENTDYISLVSNNYSLKKCDEILIIFIKGSYSKCHAFVNKKNNLQIEFEEFSEQLPEKNQKFLLEPIKEKRRLVAEERARIEEELRNEQKRKLKKYGFSSMEEWNTWKRRCSPTNFYNSLIMGNNFPFVKGDITFVEKYILTIRHIDIVEGGFSYLISMSGMDKCCSVVSRHQLKYAGGNYDGLILETMLLKYIGKGQYRQGYSILDCDTFVLLERNSLEYELFDEMMREIDF